MNVCRRRRNEASISPEESWDFICLNDFKCSNCLTGTAYVYLYICLLVSIAVYGVDTFTAVNLLAFDRWSGEIKPVMSFEVSKWIFSICIIASWVNLGFEYVRAIHVMRRGAVAESFLDSLAVRLQCIRMGKRGRGFRRFLVFAELANSKKGAEYVALFTYFSFQAWIRILICQGPRQVVNALTLWSVFRAQLQPAEAKDVGDALKRFFENVKLLADEEQHQAVILSGMIFTLVIWVFSALSLLLAAIFYVAFLWHHIPTSDGSLSKYCERKVNHRLKAIVTTKVNKALEEDERKRQRLDAKSAKHGEKPVLGRQATLPTLFDAHQDDKLPKMPMLNRQNTGTTLPLYTSRPGTPGDYELGTLDQKRPSYSRSAAGSSTTLSAPLIGNASAMGHSHTESVTPSLHSFESGFVPVSQGLTSDSEIRTPYAPYVAPAFEARSAAPPSGAPMHFTSTNSNSPTHYNMPNTNPPFLRAVANSQSQYPSHPPPATQYTPYNQPPSHPGLPRHPSQGRSSPMPQPPLDRSDTNSSRSQAGYQAYNPNIRSGAPGPSPH